MEKTAAAEWRPGRHLFAMASIVMVLLLWLTALPVYAAGGLELTTDYPGMSVKPGDNLSIPISIDNTSGSGMDADVSIASLPEGWEGYLQGGSYQVNRVYVRPGEEGASMTLHLTVPEDLEEGTYTAAIQTSSAGGAQDRLELGFQMNSQKAGAGSFTSEYPKQEGASGTSFSFSTTLINQGLTTKSYSLSSNAPSGWTVTYSNLEENVISSIPAGTTTEVIAHVEPGSDAITGDYITSFTASSDSISGSADFRVSVKTRTLWGVVAVAIILATAGGLGYVFRKYGRR